MGCSKKSELPKKSISKAQNVNNVTNGQYCERTLQKNYRPTVYVDLYLHISLLKTRTFHFEFRRVGISLVSFFGQRERQMFLCPAVFIDKEYLLIVQYCFYSKTLLNSALIFDMMSFKP